MTTLVHLLTRKRKNQKTLRAVITIGFQTLYLSILQVYIYTNPERNDLRHTSIHKYEIYMVKLSLVKNESDASRSERLRIPINNLGIQIQYSRKEDRVEICNLLFSTLNVKN